MTYNYQIKVIALGDGAVGKTALIHRYTTGFFKPEYEMTIGVNWHVKSVDIASDRVKIQLWDFEGQERFRFLLPTYMGGANGVMLAFDLTRKVTFQQLPKWIDIVRENLSDGIPILLMGNKADLEDLREVNREEAIEFAEKTNCRSYLETSAKTGVNVEAAFEVLAKQSIEAIQRR